MLANKTMKHSNPNRSLDSLVYRQYSQNSKLSIVHFLKCHLEIQKTLVWPEVKEILINYGKLLKPVTTETVPRWIKDEQSSARVYISI